ncbi:MAG: flavodoxin family protein [Negativicutes bacterium]|jgi:multimeric flavodoxin WrbA
MKIIAFNGSPRKNGNTSILIDTVLNELQQQGITTEHINVGSKQLQGCIGCMKCFENQNNKCILANDEVNNYLEKMIAADGIIIGSPVYCADLSAQTKAFIDRVSMVACANNILQRKVAAAVVAVRRAGSVHTFHSINNFFTITQMVVVGSSYWNNGFGMNPGEVLQDAEGLQTMHNLGKNMAWLIKCIDAAKNSIPAPVNNREILTNMIR